MPSTVEQLSPSRVKLTIDLPFSELKPHLDKAYREIAQQVAIPGFRKGKVPAALIDQRFGRGAILQEAINEALPGAYGKAVEESNIYPLGQPDIEVTKLEDGQSVEFTAEVDVRPDFGVPDFDELVVEVDPVATGEDAVDEQLGLLQARFASVNEVDRPAADGDTVTINLAATQDGEPVPDASADGLTYIIGSGEMLDGLDEAVTGLSAGESAKFSAQLAGGPAKGEAADIDVTVTKVSERKLPELDDDFAQLVSEFDTVAELRDDLGKIAEQGARASQAAQARDRVLDALVGKVDLELPEKLLADEVASRRGSVEEQLKRAGLSLEEYLEQSDEEAETADEFWDDLAASTERALKAQLILDKIAEESDIQVDQADLTQMIINRAAQAGTTPEAEAQHMMEHNHLPEWMGEIRRGKALAALLEGAKITDTNGTAITLTAGDADLDGAAVEADDESDATESDAAESSESSTPA